MSRTGFDPSFEELPSALTIFPLTGVLLLPHGTLPLNIFEPRYLAMTRDVLASADCLIGMVQPLDGRGDAGEPPLYRTGCAGRLTSFSETDDGRYLIVLKGIARFDVVEELPFERVYRRVRPDWWPYKRDLEADQEPASAIDRDRLITALKPYLLRHQITVDWPAVEKTPDARLVTTVAMACPFAPSEKQALLEAPDTAERARLLTALLEMAVIGGERPDVGARH